MAMMQVQRRNLITYNNDPQRRCYNGCHFSTATRWTEWETVDYNVLPEKVDERLLFWRELNAYSVKQGGEVCEVRAVLSENKSDNACL